MALSGAAATISDGVKYVILDGGKRIRPMIFLSAAELFSAPCESAYFFALGIECYHTFTLVHDDLPCMDDDDFRRGKPSCHKVFGEGQAVLIGDALQNLAYIFILKSIEASDSPVRALKAAGLFGSYSGAVGLISGQSADIDEKTPTDDKTLEYIYRHKTCDLFCASAAAGAVLGGGTENETELLTEFALNYGYVFQITDDLLDRNKNESRTVLKNHSEQEIFVLLDNYVKKAERALYLLNKDTTFFENLLKRTLNRRK